MTRSTPIPVVKAYRLLSLIFACQLLQLLNVSPATATSLEHVRLINDRQILLTGQFGDHCQSCEILVRYGDDLTYAYQPDKWHPRRMRFRISDLGVSTNVEISVKTSDGLTAPKALSFNPLLRPQQFNQMPDSPNNAQAFQRIHQDPFGGRGKDQFNIRSKPVACGQSTERFHLATVVIRKQRFGDARIDRQPTSGCGQCAPLEVEWYHEPTGVIDYQLRIQYRLIDGICNQRIRRK